MSAGSRFRCFGNLVDAVSIAAEPSFLCSSPVEFSVGIVDVLGQLTWGWFWRNMNATPLLSSSCKPARQAIDRAVDARVLNLTYAVGHEMDG